MFGVNNAYSDYFDKDDEYDELDEFEILALQQRKKKIIIFSILGTILLFFIVFTIIAIFTKNPLFIEDLVEQNDFNFIDEITEQHKNFKDTKYFW